MKRNCEPMMDENRIKGVTGCGQSSLNTGAVGLQSTGNCMRGAPSHEAQQVAPNSRRWWHNSGGQFAQQRAEHCLL